MKKFFMVTPQQPEGMLHSQSYLAPDNDALCYDGRTRFPIVPLLNGYAVSGECVQVITVTYGAPSNCVNNLAVLRAELDDLSARQGIDIDLVSIDAPFDDSVGALIHVWQLLISRIDDGDELYACITFGSKPVPIMLTMALQYGSRIKKGVSIECVVYGQMDHSQNPPLARIYDVTVLAKLDELVRVLADMRVAEPESALRMVLDLGSGENG